MAGTSDTAGTGGSGGTAGPTDAGGMAGPAGPVSPTGPVGGGTASPVRPGGTGIQAVRYTIARLAVFAMVYVIMYAVGLRGLGVILLAIVVSAAASWFLLRPQRAALGDAVVSRADRRKEQGKLGLRERWARTAAAEDDHADAADDGDRPVPPVA